MTREEFVEVLRDVLDWHAAGFNEFTTLRGHEKWDSVGLLSTLTLIDEELGIVLSSKALDSVNTVGDIVGLVEGKLS